jgi:hypothetical protein
MTLERWFFAPAPAARLALLRLLVGSFATIYLLVRSPVLADFRGMAAARFEPVGLAAVLAAPLAAQLAFAAWALCAVLCTLFAVGARFRWTGPLAALAVLWVTSYRNSWGMVFHTDNLLVLHMLALGATPAAADVLSVDAARRGVASGTAARRGVGRESIADDARYGWPVRLVSALTVATYVLAGIAKLKLSGLEWAEGEVLRSTIAHDAVRKAAVGSIYSPLGAWLVQHGWPFPFFGAFTFVVELGAPLALLGRRIALVWAALALSFHIGVLATMAIAFPYPLSGVALASLLPLEKTPARALSLLETVCSRLARVPGLR